MGKQIPDVWKPKTPELPRASFGSGCEEEALTHRVYLPRAHSISSNDPIFSSKKNCLELSFPKEKLS